MTEQQRAAMLAGRWFVVRPTASRFWRVRCFQDGQLIAHCEPFVTEQKAQKYADKLNAKEKS